MTMFCKQLKEDHKTNRTFNYSKGDVNLAFTLRIDTKDQLKDFKELLEKSLEDITEEIERRTQ